MLHEGHIVSAGETRWRADPRSPAECLAESQYDEAVEALKAKCAEARVLAEKLQELSEFGPSLDGEGLDMSDCEHLLRTMAQGEYIPGEHAL